MFRQESASSQWAFDKKLPNTDESVRFTLVTFYRSYLGYFLPTFYDRYIASSVLGNFLSKAHCEEALS